MGGADEYGHALEDMKARHAALERNHKELEGRHATLQATHAATVEKLEKARDLLDRYRGISS